MKLKLLFLILFVKCICYSQIPINNFFSTPPTNYALVTSSTEIDQSVDGANLVWSFTNLTKTGDTADTYATPTSSELSSYPGTTSVLTVTDSNTMDESTIFLKEENDEVSITAYLTPSLTLNYNSDNALLGSYPSNYTDSTTDDIGGNYIYDADGTTYSGTFTGNVVSTIDAYGTLTTNDVGQGGFNGNVTRSISVQNLDLSYSIFGNVGTATLTTYNYYDNTNGNLVFRSNRIKINVPIISIDQDTVSYESMLSNTLGVNPTEFASNNIKIFPNPVEDILNIQLTGNHVINTIVITDVTGKEVMKIDKKNPSLSVENLQKGLYIATIITDGKRFPLKFIKK